MESSELNNSGRHKPKAKTEGKQRGVLVLSRISAALSGLWDLDAILEVGLDSALDIMNGTIGGILLIDEQTQILSHRVHRGLGKEFVENIRAIEQAMGDARVIFKSRVGEDARRSFVAKRDIRKGEEITPELLDFKRPGDVGISCSEYERIVGKKTKVNVSRDEFLQWSMLE